jgi:uncharacterized protein (DUF1697 family)
VTAPPTRWVALLRGINLGRARQVDMPRLRALLSDQGYGNVRTHLRSGNVVLDAALTERDVATRLSEVIEAEFGFAVPVVVRTGAELAALVADDPLGGVATDPARHLVTFLAEPPPEAAVSALPAADRGAYVVRGRELHLWLPDGIQATPLAGWKWDSLLGIPGTSRNWNTVSRLAELATDDGSRTPEG